MHRPAVLFSKICAPARLAYAASNSKLVRSSSHICYSLAPFLPNSAKDRQILSHLRKKFRDLKAITRWHNLCV